MDYPSPFHHQFITQLHPVLNNLAAENDVPLQHSCGWLNARNDDKSKPKWFDGAFCMRLISVPTNRSMRNGHISKQNEHQSFQLINLN